MDQGRGRDDHRWRIHGGCQRRRHVRARSNWGRCRVASLGGGLTGDEGDGAVTSGDAAVGATSGRGCTYKPPPSFMVAVQIRGRNHPFYLSFSICWERERKLNQYVLREPAILGQFQAGALRLVGGAFACRSIQAENLCPLRAAKLSVHPNG